MLLVRDQVMVVPAVVVQDQVVVVVVVVVVHQVQVHTYPTPLPKVLQTVQLENQDVTLEAYTTLEDTGMLPFMIKMEML